MDHSISSNSYSELNYQSLTHNGLYSGYSSCEGTKISGATNYIIWGYYSQPFLPNLAENISLDFWWNTVANPDITIGGSSYARLRIFDPAIFQWYTINYYLSASSFSMTNDTYRAYFNMIRPAASWQHLAQRNVTNDFEQAFGSVSSTVYVYYIYFYSTSPYHGTGFTELVIDDVSMQNDSSFNYLADNGDFETGTGSSWAGNKEGRGYIGLSDDSIEGDKSLNLTANSYYASSSSSSSISYSMSSYETFRRGYYPSSPGMVEIDFDWKYTDVLNGGTEQYAYFYLQGQNESYQSYFYWFLGSGQDEIPWSNYSQPTYEYYYLNTSLSSVKGAWNHFHIDMFELYEAFNLSNQVITSLSLITNSGYYANSTVNLLIDDLQINTYPLADPSFEEEWYRTPSVPITSWSTSSTETHISSTDDSHSRIWGANLTSFENYGEVSLYRNLMFYVRDNLYTDFWWKLNSIDAVTNSFSTIKLTFEGGYNIHYILGAGQVASFTNTSSTQCYLVKQFNQTGVWNNLVRDISKDASNAFGDELWNLTRVELVAAAYGTGSYVSVMFDDMNFVKDTNGPELLSWEILDTPTYYDKVKMDIFAEDLLSEIEEINLFYLYESNWVGLPCIPYMGNYEVTLPAFDYGTNVQFRFELLDTKGNLRVDDNSGAFYSYEIIDDIEPNVVIVDLATSPSIGITNIKINASDIGSGIQKVEVIDNLQLIATLTTPQEDTIYEYNWDTSIQQDSGPHNITVVAYDNAGNNHCYNFTIDLTIPSSFVSFFQSWGTLVGAGAVASIWGVFTIVKLIKKPKK